MLYVFLEFVEGLPLTDLANLYSVDFVKFLKLISAKELGKEMDDLVIKESVITSLVLERLQFEPKNKSKLHIPLCRMISLPIVRPFLENDVMRLGVHFVKTGYIDGHGVFYVATEDNKGRTVPVTQAISNSWSSL